MGVDHSCNGCFDNVHTDRFSGDIPQIPKESSVVERAALDRRRVWNFDHVIPGKQTASFNLHCVDVIQTGGKTELL
jgi:hypothetical protein